MIRTIRAALDALAAALEQRAQEIRFGTTLTQAVATDNLTSQLRAALGDTELLNEVLASALDLAKCGVHPDEVEKLATIHGRVGESSSFGITLDDVIAHIEPTWRQHMAHEAAVDNATDTTRADDDAGHEHPWKHYGDKPKTPQPTTPALAGDKADPTHDCD